MLDPFALAQLAFERAPSRPEALGRITTLRKLVDRKHDGWLRALTEKRVEQSFSERIFAEVFGYRTLFTHGRGDFELLPQNYHPSSGRFDDFSLGFFRTGQPGEPRVLGEFKNPDANLDAPQVDYEDHVSAVEQAFRAGEKSSTVRWLIVSNFDEFRLYRNERGSRPQVLRLTEIDSVERFRNAHALLGRETLLGDGGLSPLDLIHTQGSLQPMEAREGHVRLIHEARVGTSQESLLHHLDDALAEALSGLPDPAGWPHGVGKTTPGFELHGDRIVTVQDSEATRIEFTKSGTLRVSELLAVDQLSAPDLAVRLAVFFVLAFKACKGAFASGPREYRWRLLDGDTVKVLAPPGWADPDRQLRVRLPAGQNVVTATILDNAKPKAEAWLWQQTRAALRELLYPFVYYEGDQVFRVAPDERTVGHTVGPRLPSPF